MLTTCTRCTVGINPYLIHIYLNLCCIIQLWHNITSTEGGMTASGGIKWRNTYQTMHALLRFQETISIMTLDKECR